MTFPKSREKEFFIYANSFAAPFFSDSSSHYIKAKSPIEALILFVNSYSHPCGLYTANVYPNADAYFKNNNPIAGFRSFESLRKEVENYDR